VYSSMSTAMSDGRLREFREQAATGRLVLQARRARREAARGPSQPAPPALAQVVDQAHGGCHDGPAGPGRRQARLVGFGAVGGGRPKWPTPRITASDCADRAGTTAWASPVSPGQRHACS
jgi:hypothetical protein